MNNISVIIPVYNGQRYLAEAIESVLAQTHPAHELIVVDDGSTDDSAAIAKSFSGVTCITQSNQGQGAARNNGVAHAHGNLLAFLDADDLWLPDKLAAQLALLDAKTDMVFGMVELFQSPDIVHENGQMFPDHGRILPGYHPGTMLIKKDAFLKVGTFSTSLRIGEFVDWYARAMEAGLSHTLLEKTVMRRRLHDKNIGITLKNERQDYLKAIKASLDRRRKDP